MNLRADPPTIAVPDHDAINEKLLARLAVAKSDVIESASRRVPITLCSPEGKRLYLRLFEFAQSHFHYITVFARMKVPVEEVERIELNLRNMLDNRLAELNQALVALEANCNAHGITRLAAYDVAPLVVESKVFNMLDRRMLELIEKVDQLMPMVETLCVDEIISPSQLLAEKSKYKLTVRGSAKAAHIARVNLERRANMVATAATQVPSDSIEAHVNLSSATRETEIPPNHSTLGDASVDQFRE